MFGKPGETFKLAGAEVWKIWILGEGAIGEITRGCNFDSISSAGKNQNYMELSVSIEPSNGQRKLQIASV